MQREVLCSLAESAVAHLKQRYICKLSKLVSQHLPTADIFTLVSPVRFAVILIVYPSIINQEQLHHAIFNKHTYSIVARCSIVHISYFIADLYYTFTHIHRGWFTDTYTTVW